MRQHPKQQHSTTWKKEVKGKVGVVSTYPRYRMRGGDVPRGGIPASTGHAGRSLFVQVVAPLVIIGIGILLALLASPRNAFASTQIRFANGGTATLEDDGSITGTAHVGEWDDDLGELFPITMPDGAERRGHCLDYMHYAPAAGDYPFVATPAGGGWYDVEVDSSIADYNDRQPPASSPFMEPAQRIGQITWSPTLMGKLRLVKSSSNPGISDANACYSLAGARYSVWTDEACTQGVGSEYDLTTGQDGTSNEVELTPGTYWIKETEAPAGFEADPVAHRMVVDPGELATVEVVDQPRYEAPAIWAIKRDPVVARSQGSGTLEGAEFCVRYYDGFYDQGNLPEQPTRSWTLRTNDNGELVGSNDSLVGGSGFYTNEEGTIVFPLGTVTIQETRAPKGYWLEGQGPASPQDYAAPVHLCVVDGSGSFSAPTIMDEVRRAGLSLLKLDAQTGSRPQGDASLAGITFSIVNKNENEVFVNNVTYAPGQVVTTISTGSDGTAHTERDLLPVGTYEVFESATNGSMLNTSAAQTITLVDAQTNTVVPLPLPMKDEVIRGDVAVGKISRETGGHYSQGEASLKGAIFEITLTSSQPVVVGGKTCLPGSVVANIATEQDGIARTKNRLLPFGSYSVREIKPPAGFLPNESWSNTFRIREDGCVCDLTSPAASVSDQVERGGFSFNKVDEESMERMGLTAWRIVSNTTGESHILVTDENGFADTETYDHTSRTNVNDAAVSGGKLDETKLDPEAGIWFHGGPSLKTTPNNSLAALPYDTYSVEELPSSKNEGHRLVTFTVRIHKDGAHVDMGTIDDKRIPTPNIRTKLTHEGTKVAPAEGEITLVDTVYYEGLEPGRTYQLEGRLVDKDTGEELGSDLVHDVYAEPFEPFAPSGFAEVTFVIDTSALKDTALVAYEYLKLDGNVIAKHEEIEDENQTVYVPSIGTSLVNEDGERELSETEIVELVDTVTYNNLVPGMLYELTGTLMDKDTNKPVLDESGEEIGATASFVPAEPSGSATVTFSFAGRAVRGKTLVAFETLALGDVTVARHEDIDDVEQTVNFPSIHTSLADEQGKKYVPAQTSVELIDTVEYSGLTVGQEYELTGTLMDKRSGEAVVGNDGRPVTATTTFVPENPSGSATVTFRVDTSQLEGTEVVVFEQLKRDDRELCVHAAIDDEAQTVRVPSLCTTLTGDGGTHESMGCETTLTDVVSYAGLRTGTEHVLVGTLMDKETGKPVTDSKGNEVRGRTVFTPEEPDGTVDVTFSLDATTLTGHTLVAFEYLFEETDDADHEISRHDDIENKEQTVWVPRIRTTACNAKDQTKNAVVEGTVRIRDTVTYEGLTPGATYVMVGTLHDKDSGKELGGASARVTKEFVPNSSQGNIELEFELPEEAATGNAVVVFESCLREGREVAVHADIHDDNQTVTLEHRQKEKDKEEEDEQRKGRHQAPSTGDTTNILLPAAIALLGVLAIVARRLLKRA